MDNLEIMNLYERANKDRTDDFIENTNSTLQVKIDIKKTIKDLDWIEKIEETIPYIDNIFRAPNRFIVNEEDIVKIELARKITVDSIKLLSKNTNLIQSVDKKTGDVTPSKILNINKEESYDTYENRLIYTLVQNIKTFIGRKKKCLQEDFEKEMKDNKNLNYTATSQAMREKIDINVSLNSRLDDEDNKKDNEENQKILQRIKELEDKLLILTSSDVYKIIDKKHISLVREPIKKTNVVLKNVNFQYAMKLWNYLRDNYDDNTVEINENQDYMEQGNLKKMMDETFMLQYLSMQTLEQDELESEDTRQQIKESMIEQMLNQLTDLDIELTEEQLGELISKKYEVIKYKKMQVIQEIQKIFKKHIEKYIKKLES